MQLARADILPEPDLPDGASLLQDGARLAADWQVGPSEFLKAHGVTSEHAFKLRCMENGCVTQHAQIGFRDRAKSIRAYHDIWVACAREGISVDRYGLCLDWSMAVPRAQRVDAQRGTGMILPGVEDFVRLANAAPVAPHFGDFVLGFPAALENTQAALAGGSTAIGNLGQYFTFRIPGFGDDIAATRETVRAIGLIAAQPVPVIVHSNIDDGFGAQFTDLASCLGMMLLEKDLIERLAGAPVGHCYGHHFSDPLARRAFHAAMAWAGMSPGTVIYGNTTSYRGSPAQNQSSLASYLLVDALGQISQPTGHAINAVPVTENQRIPDIDEVVDAQLMAGRLKQHAETWQGLVPLEVTDDLAGRILAGGRHFHRATLRGLADAGIDTDDLFEVLLALRRIGARQLEAVFGAGVVDETAPVGRVPHVSAGIVEEISEMATAALADLAPETRKTLSESGLKVLSAAGDVHQHGKMVVDEVLRKLGLTPLDGGVSTDPQRLVQMAKDIAPDVIAISTYNGVALSYLEQLQTDLAKANLEIPVLMGGRLNQIADVSNSSLPHDVSQDLSARGAIICQSAAELAPALAALLRQNS